MQGYCKRVMFVGDISDGVTIIQTYREKILLFIRFILAESTLFNMVLFFLMKQKLTRTKFIQSSQANRVLRLLQCWHYAEHLMYIQLYEMGFRDQENEAYK